MNNLRASIEILFRNICPDSIIDKYISNDFSNKIISRKDFSQQAFSLLDYYSHDEIENLYNIICEDWAKDSKRGISYLYQLVNKFSNEVLTEELGIPHIQYEHILRWRELSHRLGEDFFVCNYLAYKDIDTGRERSNFTWRPVIDTNNTKLRTLLSKGVAENHFHLFGSSPYCELSWVALMNNIENQLPNFRKLLKDGLLEKSENTNEVVNYHLYFLVLKAAVIRAHLFSIIKFKQSVFETKYLNELLKDRSDKYEGVFLASQIPFIQKEIDLLKYEFGLSYNRTGVADYAITKSTSLLNNHGNVLLSGERWFLYTMFSKLRYPEVGNSLNYFNDLFYTYLLCKSKFREEILQINTKIGFANFSKYQDRKDIFLKDIPVFKKAISSMAICTSQMNQSIISFETRISPTLIKSIPDVDKNVTQIQIDPIDRLLNKVEDQQPNHFYVVHFIKEKEEQDDNENLPLIKSRHWKLRNKIKKQALNLIELREKSSKVASRIFGIDAAANELYARPEIFAPVFRHLKNHHPKVYQAEIKEYLNIKPMPRLRVTYHAGEDFLDIVDGLRAIDEAIKFLELGEGDRIGHALALGIDVDDYYKFKHKYLLLSRQNLLDNYSWFLSRIAKYGLNEFMAIQALILHEFRVLFYKIYGDVKDKNGNKLQCDPILYYQSWALRGDDPDLYVDGIYQNENQNISDYDIYKRCKYPNKEIRDNEIVLDYLCAYQYNDKVKKIGAENVDFKVKDEYIKAVKVIQKKMQEELAKKHIAIECNPSSNVLIGTFKRYDKHPIVNFYNLGLTNNIDKLKECPQLMVSINTDDQGVFNTYLENEYALMAKALEKAKDEDGNHIYNHAMIHDWLERVRQMGLEMSFGEILPLSPPSFETRR